jgi:hypothetical protein
MSETAADRRYSCLLDEQPGHLVPPRLLSRNVSDASFVNPRCWFSWTDGPPRDLVPPPLPGDIFASSDSIAWVSDAATGASWPYWIGDGLKPVLERLVPGRPAPGDLSQRLRWTLAMADILVPPDLGAVRRGEWLHYLPYRSRSFYSDIVVLPHLIPPFQLGAIRLYYRRKVRAGDFRLGDEQVTRRFAAHNEPVSRFVQTQLAKAMAEILGKAIKPSYAYFVAYQGGARLAPHIDRDQCEYSMTMLVDVTPEPSEQSPWPIYVADKSKRSAVWQYLGEALLYRGRSLTHWRYPLPPDHTSSSILLHYVDRDFAGSLL